MLGLRFSKKAALRTYVTVITNVAVVLLLSTSMASAQTGKKDYQHYCAQCHGIDGKGGKKGDIEGPDLTPLSQMNGGKFPFQFVYKVIDGRERAAAHESLLNMPLWGVYFQPQGSSNSASEAKVKARITELARYIQTLQEK